MTITRLGTILRQGYAVCGVILALLVLPNQSAQARDSVADAEVMQAFDDLLGTQIRPQRHANDPLLARVVAVSSPARGRIGVAAVNLTTGQSVNVLGHQPFPLASTIKIAIAATYLDMVDRKQRRLDTRYPLLLPTPSKPHSSAVAPVREGNPMAAIDLIEIAITRSSNPAADSLLRAVGGPAAVNAWLRRAGITDMRLDHDIATMVRDDTGVNDPVTLVTKSDATTPLAMVSLLTGLYHGQWLSPASQKVLLGAMSRCVTGKRRLSAGLPAEAIIAHKTGTLYNTASDVGIITAPNGHVLAVAVYVTGQGGRPARDARIAAISNAIYDGYMSMPETRFRTASR